ncbi:MAG: alpha/beta fold hydrolase [Verrucomicrobiota bacterium]|nr:alpha/beta fold hydrolase [Verrucomicrobiota bacterium]
MNSFLSFLREPPSEQLLVRLEDGDHISLEVTTPPSWKETDGTVLLVHGLCGSHRSPNLVRMAKLVADVGLRGVRFNMRGCGSGEGLAKRIYHSGSSEDLFAAIKKLKEQAPNSPITLIGFSLGGNVVLKLAGELGELGSLFFKKVIAVSPPMDLYASILLLSQPENGIYERYFYRLLRKGVLYLQKTFSDVPKIYLPPRLKIYEFDQLYTVPVCGFRTAEDYYERCSSLYLIEEIGVPCTILLSEDDPIVSQYSLDNLSLPSHIDVCKTKHGGHMGYIGKEEFYWLDNLLLKWIVK